MGTVTTAMFPLLGASVAALEPPPLGAGGVGAGGGAGLPPAASLAAVVVVGGATVVAAAVDVTVAPVEGAPPLPLMVHSPVQVTLQLSPVQVALPELIHTSSPNTALPSFITSPQEPSKQHWSPAEHATVAASPFEMKMGILDGPAASLAAVVVVGGATVVAAAVAAVVAAGTASLPSILQSTEQSSPHPPVVMQLIKDPPSLLQTASVFWPKVIVLPGPPTTVPQLLVLPVVQHSPPSEHEITALDPTRILNTAADEPAAWRRVATAKRENFILCWLVVVLDTPPQSMYGLK